MEGAQISEAAPERWVGFVQRPEFTGKKTRPRKEVGCEEVQSVEGRGNGDPWWVAARCRDQEEPREKISSFSVGSKSSSTLTH